MLRGKFISVEGIDGAGKSTQVEFIQEYLQSLGKNVVLAREPGGTTTGEKIREILLTGEAIHPITELLLYFASRQELLQQVILPNLNRGYWVVADRFIDASIAYQGAGRKLGFATVQQVYALLKPCLTTDLTLLFDVPLNLALERISRGRKLDRIEQESREFFTRVQQAYQELARDNPQRIKTIYTNQPLAHTRVILMHLLDELVNKDKN
jgi:dTMP kinase